MAKKTKSGTDIGQVQKQNAGQYGTEFASQTNAQEVKSQNQKATNSSQSSQGQYGTEFASQTDVQKVKKQNQQAESNKGQS
ncbi:gamma-type small acid-soluble spore protein [Peribacillus psychrosaccharolyticus]|uniref:gamma-type small acid-soluble spore protein n=1 Tax=Peribacillus psychrosaccharolyticus TaxID=1407 RepID=UPI003D2C1CE9